MTTGLANATLRLFYAPTIASYQNSTTMQIGEPISVGGKRPVGYCYCSEKNIFDKYTTRESR
eukprot:SAG31_NODE_4455_length_3217_cov_2.383579_3_plen_62_part_00